MFLNTVYIMVSLIPLIYMMYIILANMSTLPEKIPMHFNIKGKADAYYTKKLLWIFPLICLLCNFITIIPDQNTIIYLLFYSPTSIFIAYITYMIIDIAKKGGDKISPKFFIILIIYIIYIILSKYIFAMAPQIK